jgi:hypothetical protein
VDWNFEGANHIADGYSTSGENKPPCAIGYDTTVRLMGGKSLRFHQYGAHNDPQGSSGACYIYYAPAVGNDFYVSGYVRYDAAVGGNEWPDNFQKLFLSLGGTAQFYFQPAMNGGAVPTQWVMRDGTTNTYGSHPGGAIQNGRWYYVEAHYKNSSPKRYQAWIDGVQIGDWVPVGEAIPDYMAFGLVNLAATTAAYDMKLNIDRFAMSASRIGPASTIEMTNSSNYATATKVYQEPLFLSDGSIQIKADLTGLGAGPYYLFVTNNRQERSTAYLLGGADSTPPAAPSGLGVQ